jgi:hypothetical protein
MGFSHCGTCGKKFPSGCPVRGLPRARERGSRQKFPLRRGQKSGPGPRRRNPPGVASYAACPAGRRKKRLYARKKYACRPDALSAFGAARFPRSGGPADGFCPFARRFFRRRRRGKLYDLITCLIKYIIIFPGLSTAFFGCLYTLTNCPDLICKKHTTPFCERFRLTENSQIDKYFFEKMYWSSKRIIYILLAKIFRR